jgi:hypothetical protein
MYIGHHKNQNPFFFFEMSVSHDSLYAFECKLNEVRHRKHEALTEYERRIANRVESSVEFVIRVLEMNRQRYKRENKN